MEPGLVVSKILNSCGAKILSRRAPGHRAGLTGQSEPLQIESAGQRITCPVQDRLTVMMILSHQFGVTHRLTDAPEVLSSSRSVRQLVARTKRVVQPSMTS